MSSAPPRRSRRRDSLDSRERLVLAAERLFAERGIEGVSLRQINRAAGQRNSSGLQYHFGTKANLVAAVWNQRIPEIEARRGAMLEQMKAAGGASDLRRILAAMVVPFAEQLDHGRNERSYVRFVAQLHSHPSIREADFASAGFRETYRAAERLLSARMPVRVVRQRLGLLIGHFVHALADFESRLAGNAGRASSARIELFVSDLLDTAVGALTVPVSAATAKLLRRPRGRMTAGPANARKRLQLSK